MRRHADGGLGLFTALIGTSMGLRVFTDPAAQPGDELAVLGALLGGAAIGELLLRLAGRDRGPRLAGFQRAPCAERRQRIAGGGGLRDREPRVLRRAAHDPRLARERPDRRHVAAGDEVAPRRRDEHRLRGRAGRRCLPARRSPSSSVQGSIAAGAFLLRDVMDDADDARHHRGRRDRAARAGAAAPGPAGGAGREPPAGARRSRRCCSASPTSCARTLRPTLRPGRRRPADRGSSSARIVSATSRISAAASRVSTAASRVSTAASRDSSARRHA